MSGFDRSVVFAAGAYGREACELDWQAGKDFKIMGGPYFSSRDLDELHDDGIEQIVFTNNRGFVAFTVSLENTPCMN